MRNQMCSIFHHIRKHNRRDIPILNRHKNILLKEVSSSAHIYPQPGHHLNQQHRQALHGVYPINFRLPLKRTSWPGAFLQRRGVQVTLDNKSKLQTCNDHGENTSEEIFNHEIEVKHVGEPIRIKPSKKRGDEDDEPPIYFLSGLDQKFPMTMMTLHLYKSFAKGHEGLVEVIRSSLSKVLSYYYPLAGKLGINPQGKFIVKCTDEGVMFVEAQANCVMNDVILRLDQHDTLLKFVYDVRGANGILENPLMTIQGINLRNRSSMV